MIRALNDIPYGEGFKLSNGDTYIKLREPSFDQCYQCMNINTYCVEDIEMYVTVTELRVRIETFEA